MQKARFQFPRRTLVLSFLLALPAACGGLDIAASDPAPQSPDLEGNTESKDVGLVQLAITTVPDAVTCVRVVADGPYARKTDLLATTPGTEFMQTLSGYPLGLVTFRADAFAQACEKVTDRTVPAWVSDTETASIIEGSKTTVTFTMHRNGRLDAIFDFGTEPACSALDIACRSDRECCSGNCATGACRPVEMQ